MRSLQDKVVLIDNGTDEIGERVVRQLLLRGAIVLEASNQPDKFQKLSMLMAQKGVHIGQRLLSLPFDIGTATGAVAAKHFVHDRWPGLDVFIANYGSNESGSSLAKAGEDDWERFINQRMRRQFIAAQSFIPMLAKRKDSVFITISNSFATNPGVRKGLDGASLAFQMELAQSLAHETNGHPGVHSLIVTDEEAAFGGHESWITKENIGEAVTLLIENASLAQGHTVFEYNWREWLQPFPEEPLTSGI